MHRPIRQLECQEMASWDLHQASVCVHKLVFGWLPNSEKSKSLKHQSSLCVFPYTYTHWRYIYIAHQTLGTWKQIRATSFVARSAVKAIDEFDNGWASADNFSGLSILLPQICKALFCEWELQLQNCDGHVFMNQLNMKYVYIFSLGIFESHILYIIYAFIIFIPMF